MTPAEKPIMASRMRRLTDLKKNTGSAPKAVTPQVKMVAKSPCSTGESERNHSK
ncbi:hypothetical protein SDC9_205046 [bioreactor metagenome]|uniref:Uncharacterized protein n=1 Tax=bioreactor metagenome TaxID=1076179 RepID=A0A645J2K9_9ZZZZ